MAIEFHDTRQGLSATLHHAIDAIRGKTVTARELFELLGEQGLLILCALLTIPFLLPISIPGVSTVFGAAIIFISIGIATNRMVWLPRFLLDREIDTERLVPVLRRGADIVSRIDRFIRPRLEHILGDRVKNRIHGLAIGGGGVLLLFPLGLVPFSNTLPGYGVLFLAIGMSQRDGLFVLLGYLMLLLTVIYFGFLGFLVLFAGRTLSSLAWW